MPLFSFLIPTRGRPDLVARLFQSIVDTTSDLSELEVILAIDDDDEASKRIRDERLNFRTVIVPEGLTMGALNLACYRASTGRYVMLMNDDVILRTPGWDRVVLGTFRQFRDDVALIHVNDLLFRERLCTFPFLSRTACDLIGLCPDVYRRYKIDDHIYETYSMLAHLGHRRIVYLPDVIFEHENHVVQPGPEANRQHVFVSQENKLYVPHGPTIEKDDRDFTLLHDRRKADALTLAAHIEQCRIRSLHENMLGVYAGKLETIREPYSFRRPDLVTVEPKHPRFSSITHRTTIAVVCPDIRKEMTKRCIDAIKRSTGNYELIVLDNAHDPNFNHPSEMNKVIRSATTDFLVLMDDDVFVEDGWLDGLMKCIDDETAVAAPMHRGKAPFSGVYLKGDGTGTHAHTVDVPPHPREMQCYCSAIILLDLRKIGHILMQEAYRKYFFDIAHSLEVWEAGYRSVCTPEVVVDHLGGGTMEWQSTISGQLVEEDRLTFVREWIDTRRVERLENGIWRNYPYLRELVEIPRRIRSLASSIACGEMESVLPSLDEILARIGDRELFRTLLFEELGRAVETVRSAPGSFLQLASRFHSLGLHQISLSCAVKVIEADKRNPEAWALIVEIAKALNNDNLIKVGLERLASLDHGHHNLLHISRARPS